RTQFFAWQPDPGSVAAHYLAKVGRNCAQHFAQIEIRGDAARQVQEQLQAFVLSLQTRLRVLRPLETRIVICTTAHVVFEEVPRCSAECIPEDEMESSRVGSQILGNCKR